MEEKAQPEAQVVFVLGGPGSGKGTQSAKLVEEFGVVHLSAGDLLRRERNTPGSEHGELISKYIKEGKIVPVEITVALLLTEMKKCVSEKKTSFLVDGFPRNEDNVRGWKEVVGSYAKVPFILFFSCSEEVMEKRLLSRKQGRTDDNVESIRKRFKTYQESSMPVIKEFEKNGLCREISCDRSVDEIYAEVRKYFL
uniref:UMP-CMP kinase n=2 Tax=Hirondellea gigas TaxID=1518452 RepID=A0A2P2I436_9CRUS